MNIQKEKDTWKKTINQYQAWNDAIARENIHNAGKKTSQQKWQEFLAVMDFGLILKPNPSKNEQQKKIDMLNQYYHNIQNFENRKFQNGQSI